MRKAHTAVTGYARVRRAPGLILGNKRLHDVGPEKLAVVKHIVRDAEFGRNVACVFDGGERATTPGYGLVFVNPQAHGRAKYFVALLLEEVCRDRAVDSSAHAY
jgi:hypothetical protein